MCIRLPSQRLISQYRVEKILYGSCDVRQGLPLEAIILGNPLVDRFPCAWRVRDGRWNRVCAPVFKGPLDGLAEDGRIDIAGGCQQHDIRQILDPRVGPAAR